MSRIQQFGGTLCGIKLIVIGDTNVGKTAVLQRYTSNTYYDRLVNTIGIDFKIKYIKINNTDCKLQIWDTAGQERFKTITHGYYRGAQGIIIMFDVTNPESFANIEYWLKSIKEHCNINNVIVFLAANKCDDIDHRYISEDRAEEFAKQNNMQYFEISAKSNLNINAMFESVTAQILEAIKNDKITLPKEGPKIGMPRHMGFRTGTFGQQVYVAVNNYFI